MHKTRRPNLYSYEVSVNVTASQPDALTDAPTSALVRWLDRAIVVLMVAILLTLSWPVSVALCGARQPVSSATATRFASQQGHNDTLWDLPAKSTGAANTLPGSEEF
jgi:hypothetical protein